MQQDQLEFEAHGAQRFTQVLSPADVEGLIDRLGAAVKGRPGRRLMVDGWTADLLSTGGPVGAVAATVLDRPAWPVRAVLFDKTADLNWLVAWHQDRTIAVRHRLEVDGFGPWSVKDGLPHVMPPVTVLEGMATLRVHLDPCGSNNAPLLVAPGSHRLGLVPAADAERMATDRDVTECHANAGDIWAYSTPILHASARSAGERRRRVLQIDYAADPLPGGLEWLGVTAEA